MQWLKTVLPQRLLDLGASLKQQAWSWAQSAASWVADLLADVAEQLPDGFAEWGPPAISASSLPCDIYDTYGTPCVAAHSTVRALYAYYDGPLYQVQRASDQATADIMPLSAGGYADAAAQDSFCAGTDCVISKIYDQSPEWNDLTIEGAGSAAGADHGADASALPITVDGHHVYGVDITGQTGYRDNSTQGIAVKGQAEGMYMVASGTHVNSGCCFDYGNAETSTSDTGNGHMDAVNLGTECYFPPCTGSGPWVEADLENGLFSGANGSNPGNRGNGSNFVTAMLKNDGQTTYALKGGDSQSGGLSTWWEGGLPDPAPSGPGYKPMQQEGAIVMGTGGDNSNWSVGSFFEGVMTAGYPSDAADAAIQADIVSAGYAGNSGGAGYPPSAAGQAVVHDGYASVYTVDSANGHLQETYLPKMGDDWSTQDLSANYHTPAVLAGTKPVTLVHDGYTSVYTVDADTGDLQETYLPKMGDGWSTQDLTAKYHTPTTSWTPTAVLHDGYVSVYTVNASNGHLQETYLPKMGDDWSTQDLSANYHTPQVDAGTSPVAIVHDGYTSVYTVDANHDLQETYLPKMGDDWSTQDLSANYHTPPTTVTPTAVVHSGYTSVWTVDAGSQDLQETYLPKMGDGWSTQDLTAKYHTPAVAPGTQPEALVHSGYTSLYTVDQASMHLQETYLPKMGDDWSTQDLSAIYHTPPTAESPIVLAHPGEDSSVTYSSVYTVDQFDDHLQETYLRAIGDSWATQDLTAKYHTPPVAAADFPTSGPNVVHDGYTSAFGHLAGTGDLVETYLPAMGAQWSAQDLSSKYHTPPMMAGAPATAVVHDGYTSVFTVDPGGDLHETYLPKMGDPWSTQDLSAIYHTPKVRPGTSATAVFHDGYTSVYTVDDGSNDLQETYLPKMGDGWSTQDLTQNYGAPTVRSGTAPVAIMHSGWTSVYVVDSSGDLEETYLPALGDPWTTQDLSAKYGTPATHTTPSAVVHSGYTSVFTVDAGKDNDNDLQETYLPAIGDDWSTQDLTAKYNAPKAAPGSGLSALYHTGYTSVYTIDSAGDIHETYLPAMSDGWSTQDLSAEYHIPAAAPTVPYALLHYDSSGGLTWTSIFTTDVSDGHLRETYLPAIGDSWSTQDLTEQIGTVSG
ncbi:MAG: hypothetical protein HOY79_45295 [Streptomyces sp.]|nr:hypothetical protein [Streptomyces sp.]